MGYKEHTAEFIKALRGGRGELDAWLECNNEAECRAAILGAIEEEREACAKVCDERAKNEPGKLPTPEAYREEAQLCAAYIRARSNA